MKVGVEKDLPYPNLLGTDMPILPDLVKETAWCGVVTRAKAKNHSDIDCDMLQLMPYHSEEVGGETGQTAEGR